MPSTDVVEFVPVSATEKAKLSSQIVLINKKKKKKKQQRDSFKQITFIKYPWKSKTNTLPNQDERTRILLMF